MLVERHASNITAKFQQVWPSGLGENITLQANVKGHIETVHIHQGKWYYHL